MIIIKSIESLKISHLRSLLSFSNSSLICLLTAASFYAFTDVKAIKKEKKICQSPKHLHNLHT